MGLDFPIYIGFFPGLLVTILAIVTLGYFAVPLWLWALALPTVLGLIGFPKILAFLVFIVLGAFSIPSVRKHLFSSKILSLLDKLGSLPTISETEKVAIEAGDTWVEKELFSGKIDFTRINKEPFLRVTDEEMDFVKNHVDNVCAMVDDWQIFQKRGFDDQVWDYLKKQKFFGMIIPKKYGGLEFSAKANSEVVSRLATRSIPLAITVMVPNSLGPSELLVHYGTEEQKDYYLPRLADGREIPCFGLTEVNAGSDAGSIQSKGEVFKQKDQTLAIKLNWTKRYITLGSVATTIGLAIKLYDPDNLLGKGKNLGITCLLIDAKLPGVTTDHRHDPLGVPFHNCPISGKDVVVGVDKIIGGAEWAGKGWQMLMECLAAGRAISLPALSSGSSKLTARVAGAYSEVRKQFGTSIGNFDGIKEQLAHIGAMAYLLESLRVFTSSAVDSGKKPSVVSAMAKYLSTEISRDVLNRGMDVLGGAGISCGPRNLLAHPYISAPIGITVEGSNILTRTMIIFGQGALRCHPYAASELFALAEKNLDKFDPLFAKHLKHIVRNKCRAMVHSFTRGRLIMDVPKSSGKVKRYYQKLAWVSSTFAFWADVAMGVYGGKLKFKESITGRFADIFNWMYLITCALRRYQVDGKSHPQLKYALEYVVEYGLCEIQKSFEELFVNLQVPGGSWFLKGPLLWWTRLNALSTPPSDQVKAKIAKTLQTPGDLRDMLTIHGLYIPKDKKSKDPIKHQETASESQSKKTKDTKTSKNIEQIEALTRLEQAFVASYNSKKALNEIKQAIKKGKLPKNKAERSIDQALANNIIDKDQAALLQEVEKLRHQAVEVDYFTLDQYNNRTG